MSLGAGRREVLAGLGATLLAPGPAHAAPDLVAALDQAAIAAPAAALRLLAPFAAAGLPASARLDLLTARAGLAIDVELAARFPFGRRGRGPYRVSPAAGAWKAAAPDAAAIDADTAALAGDAAAGLVLPQPFRARLADALATAAGNAPPPVAAALARQRDLIATQPAVPPGIGRLPGGARCYTLLLRRQLGDRATPAAAETRLEAERVRLERRADRLFRAIGLAGGGIGPRFSALWRDPRWLYEDSADGRDRAVADMRGTLADLRLRTADLAGPVPAWCLDVSLRPLTPAEEVAGKGGFREVPSPGRPGTYVVDLREVRRRPSWTLPGVVAHELLPGHMIQLGMEQETPPHPLRRDYASAFVEGWGIHAEALAGHAGAYAADPRVELGHVHWLLFRTCRALADIGVHLRGWSLAEARARLAGWQGEPAYFAPFDIEVERIALEPATRLAEALAWLAIADGAAGLSGPALARYDAAVLAGGRKRIETLPRGSSR